MTSQPPPGPHRPAPAAPRRGLGLALAWTLAVVAGCEDLPMDVSVPAVTRSASPAPSATGSARASASPGASPEGSPAAGPTPAPAATATPFPSPTPVPSRTPAPSSTPRPSPTINPEAPAKVRFVAPLASNPFTADAIDIEVEVEVPDDDAIVIEKIELFYDGVLLTRQESADLTLEVEDWDPHVVDSVGANDDDTPVPYGPHVLRAVATTTAGTSTSAELVFEKPFRFLGWKSTLVKGETELAIPSLLPARAQMALVAFEKRLYAWFGESPNDDLRELRMLNLDVFDPAWTTRPDAGLQRRRRAGAVAVGQQLFLIGGEALFPAASYLAVADVTAYDMVLHRTTPVAALPETRLDAAVAKLGRHIYVAGGYQGVGATNLRNTLYRLEVNDNGTPAGTSWQALAPMPDNEGRAGATLVAHGSQLYLLGGVTGSNTTSERILRYDPAGNQWHAEALLPRGVAYAAGASLGEHVWLFGGDASTSAEKRVLKDAVRFDPATRAVTTFAEPATNLPDGRAGAGAAVVGGELYLVGGYRYTAEGTKEYLGDTLRADTL